MDPGATDASRRVGRGRAVELLLLLAVTAAEVGDEEGALAAFGRLERLDGHIADPYLESAARLKVSWIWPIVDDFDRAVEAA